MKKKNKKNDSSWKYGCKYHRFDELSGTFKRHVTLNNIDTSRYR